ncbi:MAG: ATPase [Bacteroidales bacterium]|nr:ATPase [Bacteroidales bacterium]
MRLIADSGSTSVDWRILWEDRAPEQVISGGINPVYQGESDICEIIRASVGFCAGSVDEVWFYGAGIISEEHRRSVSAAINTVFPVAKFYLFSDLTGAAVALFGDKEGIAAILGTGSNSGYYNGTQICENVRAGGFILGDEGSGAHIGKRLISDFVKGMLPKELSEKLEQKYSLTYSSIVENVYKSVLPSRYLAQFTYFVKENESHPYIDGLLDEVFTEFFKRNILQYERAAQVKIGMIGSVAVVFKEQLCCVGRKLGLNIFRIEQNASDGLQAYFQSKIRR